MPQSGAYTQHLKGSTYEEFLCASKPSSAPKASSPKAQANTPRIVLGYAV